MNWLNGKIKKETTTRLSWVSGTSISNYLLKDPVIDWLKTYYSKYGMNNTRLTRSKTRNNTWHKNITNNVLMKNGCHFEKQIYTDLMKRFGAVNLNSQHHFTLAEKNCSFAKTLAEIGKQTPIILQAYIKSDKLKLEGVADILIRNDYLHKLVKHEPSMPGISQDPLHYVVVDIKWSHMTLCVDGKTIRNDGRFKAYKGQLLIYNIILGEIQNYTPRFAYVMPKSWNIDKKGEEARGYSCYDILGVIDYSGRDSGYVDETVKAINWVRDVRENGLGWSPLSPHIKELCCNACNQDDNWNGVKKTIMKETKDITQLWMVTPAHRNIAFDKGVKRWDDERCQASLFMNNGVKSKVINEILAINRSGNSATIKLNNIDNRYNWQTKGTRDFYIDYETISEAFIENADMDIKNGKIMDGYIFMIGIGYEDECGNFVHTSFVCNDYTPSEERRIILELVNFIGHDNARLFHWGHVEKTLMDAALTRHPSINFPVYTWIDMCSVFTSAPVVVKGSLSFKLKDITKAMIANNLITTQWEHGEMENGLAAMQQAIRYYASHAERHVLTEITKYNMIDCKVIWDIVKCLRKIL